MSFFPMERPGVENWKSGAGVRFMGVLASGSGGAAVHAFLALQKSSLPMVLCQEKCKRISYRQESPSQIAPVWPIP